MQDSVAPLQIELANAVWLQNIMNSPNLVEDEVFQVYSQTKAAKYLNGDAVKLQIQRPGENCRRLILYSSDSAGKDIAAAFIGTKISSYFQALAELDPQEILCKINSLLYQEFIGKAERKQLSVGTVVSIEHQDAADCKINIACAGGESILGRWLPEENKYKLFHLPFDDPSKPNSSYRVQDEVRILEEEIKALEEQIVDQQILLENANKTGRLGSIPRFEAELKRIKEQWSTTLEKRKETIKEMVQEDAPKSNPLGMNNEEEFSYYCYEGAFGKRDFLIVYSDGLGEMQTEEKFSVSSFVCNWLSQNTLPEQIEKLAQDLWQQNAPGEQDDKTLTVISRKI